MGRHESLEDRRLRIWFGGISKGHRVGFCTWIKFNSAVL